jgi:hypothetical protein
LHDGLDQWGARERPGLRRGPVGAGLRGLSGISEKWGSHLGHTMHTLDSNACLTRRISPA